MSVVTDARAVEEPKDPDADTIFQLFALLASPGATAELRERYLAGGMRYSDAKQQLTDLIIDRFATARERYQALLSEPAEIERILVQGAQRARRTVAQTMTQAYEAIGIGVSSYPYGMSA